MDQGRMNGAVQFSNHHLLSTPAYTLVSYQLLSLIFLLVHNLIEDAFLKLFFSNVDDSKSNM